MLHRKIKYANGYIIKDKNVSIGLTGDTSYCEGVRKIASKVDYLICDMTLMLGNDSHMGIDNILELMKEYPNLIIIPIHMHDKTRNEAKKLKEDNLLIYEDGKILEILKDIVDIEGHYVKSGGNFWIAIDNEKIIGTIALENRGDKGILKRLYIKNEYQHQGIGTKLYNAFEEYVKEKTNIKTIYLACGKVLENAHKFYIKNGFKKIDNLEIELYTVEGDDFFKKEIK